MPYREAAAVRAPTAAQVGRAANIVFTCPPPRRPSSYPPPVPQVSTDARRSAVAMTRTRGHEHERDGAARQRQSVSTGYGLSRGREVDVETRRYK